MTDNGLLLIRRPLCSYCSDPSAFIAPAPLDVRRRDPNKR